MLDDLDFTIALENEFYSVVDQKDFREHDAESIYDYLRIRTNLIRFSDYLKRYILRRLNINEPIHKYDIAFYQNYIINSFNENGVSKSFRETKSRTSAITKNWLTQASVKREVIFLLGFGLNMSVEDVSNFLINVQKEHDFNFKNPFEIICWYCYSKHLKYSDFQRLMNYYKSDLGNEANEDLDSTTEIRQMFYGIENEKDLLHCLLSIKIENGGKWFSITAKNNFEKLYNTVRAIIAKQYTEDEIFDAERKSRNYLERMSSSDKISMEEKLFRSEIIKKSARDFLPGDISDADIEKALCCGMPFDENGNLMKYSCSTLSSQFDNKRMSRKRLNDIITGKTEIDRFDLITLNYYIHAMNDEPNKNKRYLDFVNNTNQILTECYMGEMNVKNPYECFLMMCVLSDCPMGTYSDVLEMSFSADDSN
ncbi:MAG: hypothetical protein K5756_04545 [Clostridiales bacterium]|nr:hypothetical protein [Clostridiales bacterium]